MALVCVARPHALNPCHQASSGGILAHPQNPCHTVAMRSHGTLAGKRSAPSTPLVHPPPLRRRLTASDPPTPSRESPPPHPHAQGQQAQHREHERRWQLHQAAQLDHLRVGGLSCWCYTRTRCRPAGLACTGARQHGQMLSNYIKLQSLSWMPACSPCRERWAPQYGTARSAPKQTVLRVTITFKE